MRRDFPVWGSQKYTRWCLGDVCVDGMEDSSHITIYYVLYEGSLYIFIPFSSINIWGLTGSVVGRKHAAPRFKLQSRLCLNGISSFTSSKCFWSLLSPFSIRCAQRFPWKFHIHTYIHTYIPIYIYIYIYIYVCVCVCLVLALIINHTSMTFTTEPVTREIN